LQAALNAKKVQVIERFAPGRTAVNSESTARRSGAVTQFEMPHHLMLDIDGLPEVPTKNNRLGRLLGWAPDKQERKRFREQANRSSWL
jgi:hypothetical protein